MCKRSERKCSRQPSPWPMCLPAEDPRCVVSMRSTVLKCPTENMSRWRRQWNKCSYRSHRADTGAQGPWAWWHCSVNHPWVRNEYTHPRFVLSVHSDAHANKLDYIQRHRAFPLGLFQVICQSPTHPSSLLKHERTTHKSKQSQTRTSSSCCWSTLNIKTNRRGASRHWLYDQKGEKKPSSQPFKHWASCCAG